jgi:hypothetical protein
LGPSAVDDFTLGVLFVAERDDRGFAPARVGTEFRVDVRLDNLGDGLGLINEKEFEGEKRSVSQPLVRNKIESKIEDFFSLSAALEREYFLLKVLRSQSMRCGSSSHERTRRRQEAFLSVRFRSFSFRRPAQRIGDQISLAHHHKCRFVFGELDTEENSHHQKRAL